VLPVTNIVGKHVVRTDAMLRLLVFELLVEYFDEGRPNGIAQRRGLD